MSIEGQSQFLTLAQVYLHLKIKTGFSQKWLGHFEPNFILCLYLAQISGERFTGPLVLWFLSVTNFVVSVENIAQLGLNLISTQLYDMGFDKPLYC